ncbi:MAG: hypothetical protein IID37_16410, partial [Planctomycetes bacterium]|nr:hypothetical protein [Planctomycetota bacterium]
MGTPNRRLVALLSLGAMLAVPLQAGAGGDWSEWPERELRGHLTGSAGSVASITLVERVVERRQDLPGKGEESAQRFADAVESQKEAALAALGDDADARQV